MLSGPASRGSPPTKDFLGNNILFTFCKSFNMTSKEANDFHGLRSKDICTGCPKKSQFSGILAIFPLWKGIELKVGGVSKTSGNSVFPI